MTNAKVSLRHRYGDRCNPTWGSSYDELSLFYKSRAEFDTDAQHSMVLVLSEDVPLRVGVNIEVKTLTNNFASQRGGTGLGEQGAQELLAKVGMLLNEIASNSQ